MEDFDKYLDRIVEEFFDTGKLVLNEQNNLKMRQLRLDYEELTDYIYNSGPVTQLSVDSLNSQWVSLNSGEQEDFKKVNNLPDFEDDLINLSKDIVDYEEIDLDGEEETDTEEEVDNDLDNSVETLNSDDYFHRNTSVTIERKRKEHIENSNISNLKRLSIDYSGDIEDKIYISNLKTLQYILLNSSGLDIDGDDRKELIKEIKDSEFGEKTKEVLEFFQEFYKIEQTGVTDDNTWEKLMGILKNSENSKLGIIDEVDSEVTDRIKNYNKINDEGVSEDKKNLFYGFSLKLFNNLVDKELYSNIEKKQWDSYKADFESNLEKFKKEDGEVTTIRNLENEIEGIEDERLNYINKLNPWVKEFPTYQTYLKNKFDDELAKKRDMLSELINGVLSKGKRNYKVNKEGKEFWSHYISRYNQTDQRQSIKDEYVDYRNQESVEFLHEKVINSLKKSLEDKKISIDEVNEVIFSVNDAIYEVYSGDQMDNGKRDKIKGVLKDIINDINLEGDIYEIIDGLQNINVRKLKYNIYEKSFCDCKDSLGKDYFKSCNTKGGDKSSLMNKSILTLKNLIESPKTSMECAQEMYNLIIKSDTTKIDKYDIISDQIIVLENGVSIPKGKKIEVKKLSLSDDPDGFTLSEFSGLYKKSKDVESYKTQNPNHYIKYNEIIKRVIFLLNSNGGKEILKMFKGDDKMYGMFIDDYEFYHHDDIILEFNTDSTQKRFNDEKRITVKFKIKDDAVGKKWVIGNCNLQQNESTDRIDNIVENFFDTGNFDI
jgi:hypothetical protein